MAQVVEEWYKQMPVITRSYLTAAVITTVGCSLEIISPYNLYLNPRLVVKQYQIWRLITNFLYFRKMDLDFLFHMFFLARYCKLLEENSFRGRTADFFYMLLFGATVLTSIVLVGGMIPYVSESFAKIIFLSNSLTFMMVYVWSKRNPYIHMSFLGLFTFTAAYLPWVLLGFSVLVGASAWADLLIQLIRIEIRLSGYGWTIQKVFHLMNFIVYGVRAIVFGFYMQVFNLHPKVCIWVFLEVPGLLFFSTYTLLVLHWAGIYNQARSLPTDKLKTTYARVNVGVYVIQSCIWIYRGVHDSSMVHFVGKLFLAVVSFMAALGFLLYGGRLFFMLRRYPVESEGKKRKLHEVGSVATICFTFFVVRYFVDVLSAFDSEMSLDVLGHPVLNLIFYMLAEVLPSALVLFILRKLPPKRVSA